MGKIERQLSDGNVWSGKNDMSPLEGLERAVAAADEETIALWRDETMALLQHADIKVRTRAVAALDLFPVVAADVLALLTSRHALFGGVLAQGHPLFPEDLAEALYRRLARDGHPDALPALREQTPSQPGLAIFLARYDGEWLVRNAAWAVHVSCLGGVLRALPAELRPTLLRNLYPYKDPESLLAATWWRGIADADALRRIIVQP